METELFRIWHLISELSDQLTHNQKITKTLLGQTSLLKNDAADANSGFALRRVNVDLSKETFESELERTNAHIIIENQTLKQENKQLSTLLKEYEATLETIMVKFRNHALAAQQHESTLTRHYETLLFARETQDLSSDLASTANMTQSLQRISRYIRDLLLAMAGQNVDLNSHSADHDGFVDPAELSILIDALAGPSGTSDEDRDSHDEHYPELKVRADWTLERECEIVRLEKENEQLRKVLGIDPESIRASGIDMEAEIKRMQHVRNSELRNRRRDAPGHLSTNSGDQWERAFNMNNGNGNGGVNNINNNINNSPVYMWDASKNLGGNQVNQPSMQYPQEMSMPGGGPLQRSMEVPALRPGPQSAGPRIGQRFVQQQQQQPQQPRGTWVSGVGRAGGPPPSQQSTLWTNQPHSPSPQVMNDRPWPIQGGAGMDMGR
ncbi:hypothetical protein C8R42DRAFT_776301 [Lentinula raphanica]|nr:hypothetical protein C8R42DRAFT_776301 [Lentinula raphanica]